MCDTFGALASWTGTEQAIFGKNSDREPDEAQLVTNLPRTVYRAGETLRCTYISIPQVRQTHAVLLCRPFWLWGAEMGVNERGVVIGNEAIFTKVKPEKGAGLIGMDLLRLALERADSARTAADVIITLLAQFGQGGGHGYRNKRMTYMNSYLIMDYQEILVLETLGRDYVLKSFSDHAAISNAISLETDWEAGSLKVGTNIKKMGNPLITYFAGGRYRRLCTLERIMGACSSLHIQDAFAILRSHNDLAGFNRDVCMHAQGRLIRKSQTTNSLVVALDGQGGFKIFVTAGSAPCMTPFKPVLPEHLPADISRGGDGYSEDSYWWRHAAFHVHTLELNEELRSQFRADIGQQEQTYRDMPFYAWDTHNQDMVNLSHASFTAAQKREQTFMGQIKERQQALSRYWKRMVRQNHIPI